MLNFLHNDINIYLKVEINKDFQNVAKISSIINFIEKLNYKFFTIFLAIQHLQAKSDYVL